MKYTQRYVHKKCVESENPRGPSGQRSETTLINSLKNLLCDKLSSTVEIKRSFFIVTLIWGRKIVLMCLSNI